MNWADTVNTLLVNGGEKPYQEKNVAFKAGAWTGRGLGYVAQLPIAGDFLDGVMLGYSAQRIICKINQQAKNAANQVKEQADQAMSKSEEQKPMASQPASTANAPQAVATQAKPVTVMPEATLTVVPA